MLDERHAALLQYGEFAHLNFKEGVCPILVLSRKEEQRILIGPDIEIVLIECRDGTARLGIEAPEHINIRRAEIDDGRGSLDKPEGGS